MEVATDSLYLALAEKIHMIVYEVKKVEWELLRKRGCNDSFTAGACNNFFPGHVVLNTKRMIKESMDCSRKKLDALKCCVCVARHAAVTTL